MDDDAERLEQQVPAFEFGPSGPVGDRDPLVSSGVGSGAGVDLVGEPADTHGPVSSLCEAGSIPSTPRAES
jgi:hypothetical protein